MEHGFQVDLQGAAQRFRRHVLDPGGRAGDAGIVHQHVEPAELGHGAIDEGVAAFGRLHVGQHGRVGGGGERVPVDVAREDPGAASGKPVGHGAPDAAGPGGNRHPQPVQSHRQRRRVACHAFIPRCLAHARHRMAGREPARGWRNLSAGAMEPHLMS